MKFRYNAINLETGDRIEDTIEAFNEEEAAKKVGDLGLFPTQFIRETLDDDDDDDDDDPQNSRRTTFQYEAMNNIGELVKGNIEATSSEDVVTIIRTMGLFPTKIKQTKLTAKKLANFRQRASRQSDDRESVTVAGMIVIVSVIAIIALSCAIGCFFGSGFGWLTLCIVGFLIINKYVLVFRKMTGGLKQPKLCQCGSCETEPEVTEPEVIEPEAAEPEAEPELLAVLEACINKLEDLNSDFSLVDDGTVQEAREAITRRGAK